MKNKLFSLFFTTIFLLTSQLMANEDITQNDYISKKTFNISDEQELYNSLKRVFFSADHKNILDTNWKSLHISKRVTTGFIDIDVEVQNIILSSEIVDKNGTKEMSLKIFTTQNDKVTNFKSDSFLHKLFWSRLEFILGTEDKWINCYAVPQAFGHNNHLLCDINEQKALQEVKAKK